MCVKDVSLTGRNRCVLRLGGIRAVTQAISLSRPLIVVAAVFGLTGFSCSDGTLAQDCDPRMPATGQEEKVPHPKEPSSCRIVVMSCNACVYDADGNFSRVDSETCGACVQSSF